MYYNLFEGLKIDSNEPVYCTVYSRPVRTTFFFAILKTFTSVTIMYAMMNKCLKF